MCLVGGSMLQASTSFARNSYCIRLGSKRPLLVGETFGAGNHHNTLCTSFVHKYAFNTKAGMVEVLLIGASVKHNTMQTDLE